MNRATTLILTFILIWFAVLTHFRNETWRDSLTLWQDAAAKSPLKVRPLVNLGMEYQKRGDKERAIEYFSRASAAPHGLEHNRNIARANLAWMYFAAGDLQTAIDILNQVHQATPDLRVLNMLALLAVADGSPQEGLRLTDDILRVDPQWRFDPQLHLTRGQAFHALKQCPEAMTEYAIVRQLKPGATTPVCYQ